MTHLGVGIGLSSSTIEGNQSGTRKDADEAGLVAVGIDAAVTHLGVGIVVSTGLG